MSRDRLTEFEYGQLPEFMYHGAANHDRDSIEKEGLVGGHITPHLDLAAEYGSPDIWEVRKHPNMVSARSTGWEPDQAVWGNNIPPENVKRVGHVIWNQESDYYGNTRFGRDHNEIHWHPSEKCPDGFDTSWPKDNTDSITNFKDVRPHPTNPERMVGNYKELGSE